MNFTKSKTRANVNQTGLAKRTGFTSINRPHSVVPVVQQQEQKQHSQVRRKQGFINGKKATEEEQNTKDDPSFSFSRNEDLSCFDFSYFEPRKSDTYSAIPKPVSLLASSVVLLKRN